MPLKKKYPWNVLVFPAGSEVGLEICRSLSSSKEVILFGAGIDAPTPADFHFQRLFPLPLISDKTCLTQLQKLITELKIDAIFPAYDDVLLWLMRHADKIDATIISSPLATCETCRSKRETYLSLQDVVATPLLYNGIDDPKLTLPVFVKPDRGQGSHRARRIRDKAILSLAIQTEPDLLIMEYMPGREYTVDCFTERGTGVLFAQARERIQTRTGISTRTKASDHVPAMEWAENINNKLELNGAWFFQVKEDAQGQLRLLEVAPRVAGSMAFNRARGPNFPLLSLYEAAGLKVKIDLLPDESLIMGRSLNVMFRYDNPIGALYLDLDDTLIIRGQVNIKLMALIFQCRNKGIPVCLLTKHRGNINQTLEKYRIKEVFDKIIHLPNESNINKADYMTEPDSVLIDDSFNERHQVYTKTKACCFDPSAAMCLLDERA